MLYAVKTRMVDFMTELESGEVNVNSTIDLVSVGEFYSAQSYCITVNQLSVVFSTSAKIPFAIHLSCLQLDIEHDKATQIATAVGSFCLTCTVAVIIYPIQMLSKQNCKKFLHFTAMAK